MSSSVYVCRLLRSRATPHLEGFLYALKLFKSDPVSVIQGANERYILSYVHRIPGTRNTFPLLHGHFRVRGHLALLLELCGHNFLQVIGLRDYAGLPLTKIRRIMGQLLSELTVLEGRGVVHADVKPENVVLSVRRFGPIPSLSDYLAHLARVWGDFRRGECDLEAVLID